MLDLAEIAFFAGLAPDSLAAVRRHAAIRDYPAGSVICRQGEPGRAFYVVGSGGVAVELARGASARTRRMFLGPGEVFGEMSLISKLPVSATVVAARDTRLWVLDRTSFAELLQNAGGLQAALVSMLVERIRHRTSRAESSDDPSCTILAMAKATAGHSDVCRALFRGVSHYAPGSQEIETRGGPDINGVIVLMEEWRATGSAENHLVLPLPIERATALRAALKANDAVLVVDADTASSTGQDEDDWGLAEHDRLVLADDRRSFPPHARWCFHVPPTEIDAVLSDATAPWDRHRTPHLDRVTRWVTRRQLGIALSAGAARGLAHIGVLEVLEAEGFPIDCLCGTSMGGVVAMLYASCGSAASTLEKARRFMGGVRQLRDVRWFPRESLLAGTKCRDAAEGMGEGATFARISRPTAVVATDLLRGERVVLERGSIALAGLASSAIPGVLPPVSIDGRLLVDGGLLSRVPVDLLEQRRCGLKVAVNVVVSPRARATDQEWLRELEQGINGFFGLGRVISRSWELLGWWQGAVEGERADILIEPTTSLPAGYDFDAIEEIVEAGRQAASDQLPALGPAVQALLRPGTP